MTSFEWQAEIALVLRLPQLLSLKSVLPDSTLLEQIIAIAVEATLPIGLDGCPSSFTLPRSASLIIAVRRAESRWAQRSHGVKADIDIRPFLIQDMFSDSTAKIVSCLAYQQSSSRQALVEWLQSDRSLLHEPRHLIPVIHAFVDSSSQDSSATPPSKIWLPFISRIVQTIADIDIPTDIRTRAQSCLLNILSASGANLSKLLDAVTKGMKNASRTLSHELISTAVELATRFGSKAESTVASVIDHGLQWCIDQFAEEHDAAYDILIQDLSTYPCQILVVFAKPIYYSATHQGVVDTQSASCGDFATGCHSKSRLQCGRPPSCNSLPCNGAVESKFKISLLTTKY